MRPVPSIVILWPVVTLLLDSILARAVASAAVETSGQAMADDDSTSPPEALERRFLGAARRLLQRLAEQDEAIDRAASICADAIGADGLVHVFGTGHSRIGRGSSRATARSRASTRSSSFR